MKKILIITGSILFIGVLIFNLQILLNENSKSSTVELSSIIFKLAQAEEEDGYPDGAACGSDECSITCGIPPITSTAEGDYWHCKTTDLSGTCDENACEVSCDAECPF